MKSERAERILERYKLEDAPTKAPVVVLRTAARAVELAEADAEARVRKAAVAAFKRMCPFRDSRCTPKCTKCSSVRSFRQEMEDEEASDLHGMRGCGGNKISDIQPIRQ